MDKDGGVFPGRRLQAELGVRRLGVVGEGDGAGQLAIVQHLLVVLGQVDVTLRLKLERALQQMEKEEENVKESCEKNFKSERHWPKARDEARDEFNTQNGVCLIAAWALCKQHSISLMNTELTQALIQLAQNERWAGEWMCERGTQELQIYLSAVLSICILPTKNTQNSTDTFVLFNFSISRYTYPARNMNFNLSHELLKLYLVKI